MVRNNGLVCVDLFSGLGGFSEAFLKNGWTVYRYDNDKEAFGKIPCTHVVDVLDLTPEIIKGAHAQIDIMLLSPPCNCFSPMTIGHYWKNGVPDDRAKAAIALVKYALWLKDQIQPKYWVLENPAGPLMPLKTTHLWGLLPSIDWPRRPRPGEYIAAPRGAKLGIQETGLSSAERALVPYNFSMALCESIEQNKGGQTQL